MENAPVNTEFSSVSDLEAAIKQSRFDIESVDEYRNKVYKRLQEAKRLVSEAESEYQTLGHIRDAAARRAVQLDNLWINVRSGAVKLPDQG